MPSQNGRDLLLKIGDGGEPETFTTIGAARAVEINLDNQPIDATAMNSNGISVLRADAGVQSLAIILQGLFKDSAAEETLRATAFNRTANNYRLLPQRRQLRRQLRDRRLPPQRQLRRFGKLYGHPAAQRGWNIYRSIR